MSWAEISRVRIALEYSGNRRIIMSGSMSRARQMAEIAFDKTQSRVPDRTRAMQERDVEIAEREEKTRRLRAARLERERGGRGSVTPS